MTTGLAINRVYQTDCLDGMKLLKDRSIDMILSDLPYGMTKNPWDCVIDLEALWAQYRRLIKPKGVIALTAQCPFDKLLGVSNRKWLRYEWIWEKSRATGFLNAKHAPLKAHENILIFYNVRPRYNPQFTAGKPYRGMSGSACFNRNLGKLIPAVKNDNNGYRYPRTVLRIACDARPFHPTQKPVALFEYLIRTYTKRGDLVLDSCMGSGTTAIACLNTGRRFIGFELDAVYHRAAEERIRQRCRELNLNQFGQKEKHDANESIRTSGS